MTSVIYFKDKPLSYSSSRSIYSPETRAEQTLKTIQSIREKMPGAKIFLFELGLKEDLPHNLKNSVDLYVFLGNKKIVRWAVDGSKKGFGEAVGLIYGAKYIKNQADYYFKISGRYYLNDDFEINDFLDSNFAFLKYDRSISTRLYGFSQSVFNVWYRALWLSLLFLYFTIMSIEFVLPKFIKQKYVKSLNRLGISGFIAPGGEYIKE